MLELKLVDEARILVQEIKITYNLHSYILENLSGLLAGQAEVGDGGNVPGGNVGDVLIAALAAVARDFASTLRRVILVGEPALRSVFSLLFSRDDIGRKTGLSQGRHLS